MVAVVVATLAAGSTADPSVPRVLAWTIAMTALVAAPAIAVGSGRAAIWAAYLPATVRAGAAVAGAVLRAFLLTSALVFLVALAVSFDDAATLTSQLHPSPSEAGLYALVNAAFVPNAALFTGSYLLGPGFAVGGATLVSPGAVVLGPLPARAAAGRAARQPVRRAGWVALRWCCAAAGGGRAGLPHPARPPALRGTRSRSPGAAAAWLAGFGFAVLASVSGGAAGPGRMRFVGPFARDVLVHGVPACGIGALLGAGVVALLGVALGPRVGRRRRRRRPWRTTWALATGTATARGRRSGLPRATSGCSSAS